MKVSVLIPTYNRRNCVMNAVNSVLNAEPAPGIDYEIVIVDDGSTDQTWELFIDDKNPRVKYFFYAKNQGVNYARNYGVSVSSGDYILLLDSDDTMHKMFFWNMEKVQLAKITFFATGRMEGESLKTMYKVKRPASIMNLQNYLAGDVSGEAFPLIHKSVFNKFKFDERHFCFESFFWNRAIREYGFTAYDSFIGRIYSFEQPNRVSNLMVKRSKAKQRAKDYTDYLREFGDEYKEFGLYDQYWRLVAKKWFYRIYAVGT